MVRPDESPRFVVRTSLGRFAAERFEEIERLISDSEVPLAPAIKALRGLKYYHASVDRTSNTVLNVSLWTDLQAAKQLDTLPAMLAQRPILEKAGVRFDPIVNYEALWTIGDKL